VVLPALASLLAYLCLADRLLLTVCEAGHLLALHQGGAVRAHSQHQTSGAVTHSRDDLAWRGGNVGEGKGEQAARCCD